jgi:hypothetical protein
MQYREPIRVAISALPGGDDKPVRGESLWSR